MNTVHDIVRENHVEPIQADKEKKYSAVRR